MGMALEALKDANRVIGIKQVAKALRKRSVREVYIADDADARCIEPLMQSCREQSIEPTHVGTMKHGLVRNPAAWLRAFINNKFSSRRKEVHVCLQ